VLLAAQLIVEEALEAEVRDEVGRERYERTHSEASGYRNGVSDGSATSKRPPSSKRSNRPSIVVALQALHVRKRPSAGALARKQRKMMS
jgi:hypothetical protein